MAYGIVIRITHTGLTPNSILIDDLAIVEKGTPISKNFYIPYLSTIEIAYGSLSSISYEKGKIREFILNGYLNAEIILGDDVVAPKITTDYVNLYVNATSGNDSNDGLTPSTAFKTIQAAINNVELFYDTANSSTPLGRSVTINIASGTYAESPTFKPTYPANVSSFAITLAGAAQSLVAGPFTVSSSSNIDPDNSLGNSDGATATITVAPNPGWTVNNFRGRFVVVGSTHYVIVSNTADTIEYIRGSTLTGGISNGNVFEVRTPSTVINGTVSTANSMGRFELLDLEINSGTGAIILNSISISPLANFLSVTRCRGIATGGSNALTLTSALCTSCYFQGPNAGSINASVASQVSVTGCYFRSFNRFFMLNISTLVSRCVIDSLAGSNTFNGVGLFSAVKLLNSGAFEIRVGKAGFNGRTEYVLSRRSNATGTHIYVRASDSIQWGSFTCINGEFGLVAEAGTSIEMIGNNANFSATLKPVTLKTGSLFACNTVTGTGNAANPAIRIEEGSRLIYQTLPTITGTSSDFRIDGVAKNNVDMPFIGIYGSASTPFTAL